MNFGMLYVILTTWFMTLLQARIGRQKPQQIGTEGVFFLHISIKHTAYLRYISIPLDIAAYKSAELIAFIGSKLVISVRNGL